MIDINSPAVFSEDGRVFNWDEGWSGRLEGAGENRRERSVMATRLFCLYWIVYAVWI